MSGSFLVLDKFRTPRPRTPQVVMRVNIAALNFEPLTDPRRFRLLVNQDPVAVMLLLRTKLIELMIMATNVRPSNSIIIILKGSSASTFRLIAGMLLGFKRILEAEILLDHLCRTFALSSISEATLNDLDP
jgi:hypothetical protein